MHTCVPLCVLCTCGLSFPSLWSDDIAVPAACLHSCLYVRTKDLGKDDPDNFSFAGGKAEVVGVVLPEGSPAKDLPAAQLTVT